MKTAQITLRISPPCFLLTIVFRVPVGLHICLQIYKDSYLRTRPAALPNPEVCIWSLLKTYIHFLMQIHFQSHLPVVCEVGDEEGLSVHYDHPVISQSVIIPSWSDTTDIRQ